MTGSDKTALPKGWIFRPLVEVAQINPPLGRSIPNDRIPVTFVPMRAVETEGGGLTNPETRSYGEVKKGHTAFLSGDVIMAKITPCMENGKTTVVPKVPGDICFGSTEFHVVRVEEGIVSKWVEQFLLQHKVRRKAKRQMAGGVGQMRVPAEFLKTVEIPIAPLAEQIRIAAVLDELLYTLDAGIAALERVRDNLKLYRTSALKEAMEGSLTARWRAEHPQAESARDLLKRIHAERRCRWEEEKLRSLEKKSKKPPKNWKTKYKEPMTPCTANSLSLPEGWAMARLGDLAEYLNGAAFKPMDWEDEGIPIIRIQNLTDSSRKLNLTKKDVDPRLLICNGDLLFSWSATLDAFLWHGKEAWLNQHIFKVEPEHCISQQFLYYLLRYMVREIATSGHIHGSTMQHINRGPFLSQLVKLPPRHEQDRIADILNELFSVLDRLEADLNAWLDVARGLRQSILYHAFNGKLVPQDPNDELASALLERIAIKREARAREATAMKRRTGEAGSSVTGQRGRPGKNNKDVTT